MGVFLKDTPVNIQFSIFKCTTAIPFTETFLSVEPEHRTIDTLLVPKKTSDNDAFTKDKSDTLDASTVMPVTADPVKEISRNFEPLIL